MIKNTITVTIPFSYKGVQHNPSSIVDLDSFALNNTNFDPVFYLVATENKIDNYSYEYEVLESSQLVFSNPTGLAANYLMDDTFDLEAFKQSSNEGDILELLAKIAKETLNIDDLENNKKIKKALLQAYKIGTNSS